MRTRVGNHLVIVVALVLALAGSALAQAGAAQSELSALQRLDVMRSKLESMRRSLSSAISSMPSPSEKEKSNADDPRQRLRGLDKEVGSLLSEVNDIRSKQERSERYDQTILDRLETSVTELNTRVQSGLQSTASARTATTSSSTGSKKKKGKFLGLFGGGGDEV